MMAMTHTLSSATSAGGDLEHANVSGGWKALARIVLFLVLLPLIVCYALRLFLNETLSEEFSHMDAAVVLFWGMVAFAIVFGGIQLRSNMRRAKSQLQK